MRDARATGPRNEIDIFTRRKTGVFGPETQTAGFASWTVLPPCGPMLRARRALLPWRSKIHSKKVKRGGASVLPIVKRVGLEDDDVVRLVFDLADCRAGPVNETKRPVSADDIENVLLRSVVSSHGSAGFNAAPCDLNAGSGEFEGRCVSEALVRLALPHGRHSAK